MAQLDTNIIGLGQTFPVQGPFEVVNKMNTLIGSNQGIQKNNFEMGLMKKKLDTQNKLEALYNKHGVDYKSMIPDAQAQGLGLAIPEIAKQSAEASQAQRLEATANIENVIKKLEFTSAYLEQATPDNYHEILPQIEATVGQTALPRVWDDGAISRAKQTGRAIKGKMYNDLELLKFQHQMANDEANLGLKKQELALKANEKDNSPPVMILDEKGMPKMVRREESYGKTPYIAANAPNNKPLPAQALKLQQEALDIMGVASNTQKDLSEIKNQIDTGKLPLGLWSNKVNEVKNYLGISTPESENFATFTATMEKIRNDSLLLNKGVQTEGDSIRAWNQLFKNLNDENVVSKRLEEIKKINERAVNLQRMNVDVIRSNYGKEPLDTAGYTGQKTAITSPQEQHPLYNEYQKYLMGQ
jgi:cell fate (sporulation/competence/biofilm development) regulator YmcA (YheA/YmcA/DUF963 family)